MDEQEKLEAILVNVYAAFALGGMLANPQATQAVRDMTTDVETQIAKMCQMAYIHAEAMVETAKERGHIPPLGGLGI